MFERYYIMGGEALKSFKCLGSEEGVNPALFTTYRDTLRYKNIYFLFSTLRKLQRYLEMM